MKVEWDKITNISSFKSETKELSARSEMPWKHLEILRLMDSESETRDTPNAVASANLGPAIDHYIMVCSAIVP